MGKMKKKDTKPISQNDAVKAESGILSTLFGAAEVVNPAVPSLFSDNNPFRRKPTESVSSEKAESIDLSVSDKKRKEERKRNHELVSTDGNGDDEDSGTALKSVSKKKSKKEKSHKAELVSDTTDSGANEEGKKKKKRKKDEIETQYEEKMYGATSDAKEEEEEEGKEKKAKKVGEKRKKPDDSSDAVVAKEGFDDENKLSRTVFVGNLPLKVKKKTILKEFTKFGEVESVRIRSVPIVDTKKTRKGAIMQKQIDEKASSVNAYVVFKTDESAEASLANNMSLLDGNHIRVDRACPPCKKSKGQSSLYDPKRTVFVGNLPFDVKDEEMYQLFTSMNNLEGALEAVRVVRDPHVNVGKGIAYVLFKTKEAANALIRKGNLKLRDRELRVSRVKSDATPSKRNNPSSSSSAAGPAKRFSSESNNSNGKPSLSYQGLRASKSDSNKKNVHQKRPSSTRPIQESRGKREEKPKERSQKRPAVAARKAKANAMRDGGGRQGGFKRKQDGRTSGSSGQKKKSKRF